MSNDRKTVLFPETPEDKWERDVWLTARRMALLYHYLAGAIVDRLGPEEGYKLVKDAVWKYGLHCGRAVRDVVLADGQQLTAANFAANSDLPSRGWRAEMVGAPDGRKKNVNVLCPLARTWQHIGTDPKLARLYCFVDQSKIEGYNGQEYECVHAHNVLDGDPYCEILVNPKSSPKGEQ